MYKFVVIAHRPRMFLVEAENKFLAGLAVRDVLQDVRTTTRVKEDKEYAESPAIDDISTFDQYYGDDKPQF